MDELPTKELDITADTCPMTFVRTRLALDSMPSGAVLRVRLRGEEPRLNVPQTAESLGHTVIACDTKDDITTVTIRKL